MKELRPDLFALDSAAKVIKVDGFIENLTSDMENFKKLHDGLDYLPKQENGTLAKQSSKETKGSSNKSPVKANELVS